MRHRHHEQNRAVTAIATAERRAIRALIERILLKRRRRTLADWLHRDPPPKRPHHYRRQD
jgi:hypothetical protein